MRAFEFWRSTSVAAAKIGNAISAQALLRAVVLRAARLAGQIGERAGSMRIFEARFARQVVVGIPVRSPIRIARVRAFPEINADAVFLALALVGERVNAVDGFEERELVVER